MLREGVYTNRSVWYVGLNDGTTRGLKMTTTWTPATDKQLAFAHALLKDRDVPVAGKDEGEARVIARCEDIMGGKAVSKLEASDVISYLKTRPFVAKKNAPAPQGVDLPASKYALPREGGGLEFFEVVERKSGKYVNRLVGHPGDWKRYYLSKAVGAQVKQRIESYGPKASAKLFADEFKVCAKCLSPLSDELSRARGIGPVCWTSF